MKRSLCLAILPIAGLALTACNGTVSSIGVPANSPWTQFLTELVSPYDDLTVVTTGSNITAGLVMASVLAQCDSHQGEFIASPCGAGNICDLDDCLAGAPADATNVRFLSQQFDYELSIGLDRPAFSAGGVQLESATAGTVGAIAVTLSSGSGLSVGAGFSEGLVPKSSQFYGATQNMRDDGGSLIMVPHWADFGPGYVCADGTSTSCDPESSPENVVAACINDTTTDNLGFRVDAAPGSYSLTCGSVPINLTINPAYASAGACISDLKAMRCGGLKGQDRSACVHAQQGICQATFNIPSAHTP